MKTAAGPALGRPRSDAARIAVLHAVDDMLVEEGYAAMTMKGVAARAGVGRQTVYRWWNSKAEILLEAVKEDARDELAIGPGESTPAEYRDFLARVSRFLTESPAGAAYRALVGEAQHDAKVAELIRGSDVLVEAAVPVLKRAIDRGDLPSDLDLAHAAAELIGPVFFRVLAGPATGAPQPRAAQTPRPPRLA
ncbi:MAG TPA: TetR/AcrR family transcriptional regulator [Galbitalea sp.]|jgi:AcrR family transcriptional regulator|nr:TetR/AcrR family transcriptional regulator [Galbitalea sp.]